MEELLVFLIVTAAVIYLLHRRPWKKGGCCDPSSGVCQSCQERGGIMVLRDAPEGFEGEIVKIKAPSLLKKRLLELGFLPGRSFKVIRNAPLKDPLEVEIMGYFLAIRKEEARYILVKP